ncbi:MAG: N-acetyl sugar amidotransferase [Candidatus Nealsonbacteria bacterium]|nr:N-acetyl sugar amidotransferase [Candidatus Nealsonbacteria bacterium]
MEKPSPEEQLKRCRKCVMPETWESINFDNQGVCNVCHNIEIKREKIDWAKKREEFVELLKEYRGKGQYDCMVPFSGGKDSTYTVYTLVRDFHLKPLVVSFDHGFYRPKTQDNRVKTLKQLGVDFLSFRPNWQVVKKVMMESLKRKGDFCWHCHTGVYAYPMQIAVKFNIPLIIWGQAKGEYEGYFKYNEDANIDEELFNRYTNLGINAEDMVGMIDGVTMRDLEPFKYPSKEELSRIKCCSVGLGAFIPWDVKKQAEIIEKELGWQEDEVEGIPPGYGYEKVECMMQGVRDYLKYIKRGLGRTAHLASIDIRDGRMTREEGMKLIKKYDGLRPASLDVFLKFLDITEEEFMEIALSHQVAPHKHDPSKVKRGKKLWDQDLWEQTP